MATSDTARYLQEEVDPLLRPIIDELVRRKPQGATAIASTIVELSLRAAPADTMLSAAEARSLIGDDLFDDAIFSSVAKDGKVTKGEFMKASHTLDAFSTLSWCVPRCRTDALPLGKAAPTGRGARARCTSRCGNSCCRRTTSGGISI